MGINQAVADEGEPNRLDCIFKPPLETVAEDILTADAILLGTTENLGYMAGATKDMFDRCYYSWLDQTDGKPVAIYIRAGHDGTGTSRALDSIVTGLRWRKVAEPVICRGTWQEGFSDEVSELGQALAAGLLLGVF